MNNHKILKEYSFRRKKELRKKKKENVLNIEQRNYETEVITTRSRKFENFGKRGKLYVFVG